MKTNHLPYGAAEILELRKSGKRPADMVLVSLIGPLRESNPVVIARPENVYDWSFLIDLPALVVVNANSDKQSVRRVLDAIKALPARSLSLWLADCQNGRHLIVDGVPVQPRGLLQYMDTHDLRQYTGLGLSNKENAPCE